MLAIRLPAAVEKRLDKLAKRTGRTKSFYVREAILQRLEDQEDLYLAEQAYARHLKGKGKTIPLEESMKRLGMRPSENTKPLHSLEGLLEDLNVDITEQDISKARRETWGTFPRDIS